MNVLLIDDDKVFTEPLMWQLEQAGYNVTYCQAVDDVLDESGELKIPIPDCIILDIMMPRGNRYNKHETNGGRDTGRRLLEDIQKKASKVPVIITSVRPDISRAELHKKFGDMVREILVKPVTPTRIIKEIERLFPHTIKEKRI